MYRERIRMKSLLDKVMNVEEAAQFVKDGMVVGMSGFTRAGDAKLLPPVLAERAKKEKLNIAVMTGASLGLDLDKMMAESGLTARRMPYQADPTLRKHINDGKVMYIDSHLSHTPELLRAHQIGKVDVAIVEATAITKEGGIVPTTSVGNSPTFAMQADKIIIELSTVIPLELEGTHDIYIPQARPNRPPLPIMAPDTRIGLPYIPVDPSKIAAIVVSNKPDSASTVTAPDDETQAIANHLIEFFKHEVKKGRYGEALRPLQAGIGSIANAVMSGFIDGPFSGLTMYSEVLQDSTFELIDAGKMDFASCCSLTLSAACAENVIPHLDKYRDKIVIRPQEISNHPEVVRRLGIIGINTALEFDMYGNVNSTHVNGTHMMNGIGGSGDFARNCFQTIFVTKSLAKGGNISSIVPMVTHTDHTEHDVMIVATEIGLADLRGLAPRERPAVIIENCVHPSYRDQMRDYYREALKRGGQTPHVLENAFSWHTRYRETGSMKG